VLNAINTLGTVLEQNKGEITMLKKIAALAVLAAFSASPALADGCAAKLKALDAKILGAYTKMKPAQFDRVTAARDRMAEACSAFDGNKASVAEAELNAELAGKPVDMNADKTKGKKMAAKAEKKAAAPAAAAPAKK
jgi:hypothetical protein